MTAAELIARFPQIPAVLRGEPVLERFAATFGDILRTAVKPSPCSASQQTAENHLYLKLVGPLELVAIGLATKERAIADREKLIAAAEQDRDRLLADLVPADAARRPGGCAG